MTATLFDVPQNSAPPAETRALERPRAPHSPADLDWLQHVCDTPTRTANTTFAWQFTQLLALRNTVRIHTPETGGYTHTHTVAHTPPPERPWALNLTDTTGNYWYLVLDLDTHTRHTPRQVNDDLTTLTALLTRHAITYTVCASSTSGGKHVWIALAEPLPADDARAFASACQNHATTLDISPLVNPTSGSVRPPYSPHPAGGISQPVTDPFPLLTPTTTPAHIRAFTREHTPHPAADTRAHTLPTHTDGHPWNPGTRRPLPARIRELAATSNPDDHSAAMWTILTAAVRAHWTFTDLLTVIDQPGLTSLTSHNRGTRPRTRRRDITRYAARVWVRAVETVTRNTTSHPTPAGNEPSRLDTITTYIDTQLIPTINADPWFTEAHNGGPNSLRVLVALADWTRQAARYEIAADVRRLAEATGMSHVTAAASLKRLQQRGYVRLVLPSQGRDAAVWTVMTQPAQQTLNTPPLNTRANARPSRKPTHQRLHLWLTSSTLDGFWETPALANAYANQQSGLHLPTSETVPANLDVIELARQRGTVGVLERMKARHLVERILWSWWCDELAFLRKRGTAMWHRVDKRWYTGKTGAPVWGRFPRTSAGLPDFETARTVVTARHTVINFVGQ